MKKLLTIILILTAVLCSCGRGSTDLPETTSPETTDEIAVTDAITTEAASETKAPDPVLPPSHVMQFEPDKEGIYNYCPTVITEADGTRYIYYCTNKDSFAVIDYIGCRKGTPNADGSYTWSEETLVLAPSEAGKWDAHHTCDPSVIKGKFNYGGKDYSYLMAYLGCTSYDNQENKIGLAVSNSPMGPFTKVGSEPLVDFKLDPSVTTFQWGVGQPSLVSINKEGKVWLFYTRGDKNGTRVVMRECDFTSLDSPTVGDETALSKKGLKNLNGGDDFMNNADFAYDPVTERIYVASDCHPNPADDPNYIAGSFRINYLNSPSFKEGFWRTYATIGQKQTQKPRNHNVGLARDEYGHIPQNGILTVYYTVSETGQSSLWSYRIYEYNVFVK
jgi:hypothetical protein